MSNEHTGQQEQGPEQVVAAQVDVSVESDQVVADDSAEPVEATQAEVAPDDGATVEPAGAGLDELIAIRARLESAEGQLSQQKEEVLRTQAEMQNVRRRAERDVESAHKFALEKFVNELLPVIDSLERGLESIPADDPAQQVSREGISLTLKMFLDALGKFQVEQINPQGESFDPQLHQAMSMQESEELEPNTVVAVLQKGFTLSDRLVRPAMVMVSKAPASA